ncbi:MULTISPECIES: septum formation initiator family protein [Prevotella]|jgi:cell division protein DivIC|uniref:FtsB family cell division protein n=1 Tax=Prevotella TaxID=838 RepID=UPI000D10A2E4|nr:MULTISPECIES: septum formation initiator family protein [Prevotella]
MGRLKLFMALVSHYKYAITIVVGILLVGFVDENSFMHRVQLEMRISDLTEEIERYNAQNEADLKQLKELRRGPEAYKQIARERYMMKTDDEDIYVLSDDEKPVTNNNETTE